MIITRLPGIDQATATAPNVPRYDHELVDLPVWQAVVRRPDQGLEVLGPARVGLAGGSERRHGHVRLVLPADPDLALVGQESLLLRVVY